MRLVSWVFNWLKPNGWKAIVLWALLLGLLHLSISLQGTWKDWMSSEFMGLWQVWESLNKTEHRKSVRQTFPRSPGGFHILPTSRASLVQLPTLAIRAKLSYPSHCSLPEPDLQSDGQYKGFSWEENNFAICSSRSPFWQHLLGFNLLKFRWWWKKGPLWEIIFILKVKSKLCPGWWCIVVKLLGTHLEML